MSPTPESWPHGHGERSFNQPNGEMFDPYSEFRGGPPGQNPAGSEIIAPYGQSGPGGNVVNEYINGAFNVPESGLPHGSGGSDNTYNFYVNGSFETGYPSGSQYMPGQQSPYGYGNEGYPMQPGYGPGSQVYGGGAESPYMMYGPPEYGSAPACGPNGYGGYEQPPAGQNALSNIDMSGLVETDAQGNPLQSRKPSDVKSIEICFGEQQGDAPPNFVVDSSGQIHEIVDPAKKRDSNDNTIIVDIAPDATTGGFSESQLQNAEALVMNLKGTCTDASINTLNPGATVSDDARTNSQPAPEQTQPAQTPQPAPEQTQPAQPQPAPEQPQPQPAPQPAPESTPSTAGLPPINAGQAGGNYEAMQSIGLNPNSATDRVALMLSMTEGGPSSINWNDVGDGVSAGFYQANQHGDLPGLLQQMYQADPSKFDSIFGADASKVADPNQSPSLDFANNGNPTALGNELQSLFQQNEFQQVELVRDRQRIEQAAQTCKQEYGVTSAEGVALYVYLQNWGPALADQYFAAAKNASGQQQKIDAVSQAASGDPDATSRIQAAIQHANDLGLTANETFSS